MARSDIHRWNDFRAARKRPYKPERRCKCGRRFIPQVARQPACVECIAKAVAKAKTESAEEGERRKFEAAITRAERKDAARLQEREGEHPTRPRTSVQLKERRQDRKGIPQRPLPRKAGGRAQRSKPVQWEHVAIRKRKENWSSRKIAKFLGVPLSEVRGVLREGVKR